MGVNSRVAVMVIYCYAYYVLSTTSVAPWTRRGQRYDIIVRFPFQAMKTTNIFLYSGLDIRMNALKFISLSYLLWFSNHYN